MEPVLIASRKSLGNIEILVENQTISSKQAVTYLGLTLDNRPNQEGI